MVWLILAIIAIGVALMAFKVVTVLPGLAGMLLALMAAVVIGARLDRSRQRGRADPAGHFDRNRGDFHGEAGSWTVPTPYIDHPDGGGEPPGVDTPPRG